MISDGIISGTAHEDPRDNLLDISRPSLQGIPAIFHGMFRRISLEFSRILHHSNTLFSSNLLRDYYENFFKDYFNISSRNLFHYFFSHIYLIVTLGDILKNATLVFLENT